MGLLDALFGGGGSSGGSQVKPELVDVNPETIKAMNANKDTAINTSAEDYAKKSMEGINGPQDHSDQVAQSEQSLGGSEPGMQGAISSRYQGLVGQKLNNMANQAKLKGFESKGNALATSNQMEMAKNNIDSQNRQRQLQADNANSQARNSTLSSVLGIGAMIAGQAIGIPAPVTGAVMGTMGGGGGGGAGSRPMMAP